MRQGNSTGTQHQVEERNVWKDSDKGGLEEEAKDHVAINHTLLRDGEVTGLADKQVGPLHNNNRDKVTTLSVTESFGSVADLLASDRWEAVECGLFGGIGVPAARSPRWSGAINEEKTEINIHGLETIPVELWSFVKIAVIGISCFFGEIGSELSNNSVNGLVVVSVTESVGVGGVVDISVLGDNTILKSKEEGSWGRQTVIIEHVEIGEETSRGLNDTNLEISEGNKLSVH